MMNKRRLGAGLLAALLLTLTGCGDSGSSSAPEVSSAAEFEYTGLQVDAAEGVDPECAECIRSYFLSLETRDYDAYQKTIYPPYRENCSEYFKKLGSSPEESFEGMCSKFDEDGYESWKLTKLTLSYYGDEKASVEEFFMRFINDGVFDEKFAEKAKADAKEMHDVIFSLDAIYAGDSQPVTVVPRSGILAIKNADGWFVFG